MRKLLLAALSAGALTLAGTSTANAASTITGVTPAILAPPASALFGAVITGTAGASTPITDTFTFNIVGAGVADAQVSTVLLENTQNINFSSITLDGLYPFVKTSNDPGPETWALNPVELGDGMHSIVVLGTLLGPTGSYSGTLNVQPVPEPQSWAMMLLGFGAIGLCLRTRRRPRESALASPSRYFWDHANGVVLLVGAHPFLRSVLDCRRASQLDFRGSMAGIT
ncbi:MAG TPA: FxDxF family PEP-CTERM protein [Sphingomicrobium sp.]|nr:FxDxF family PEP-CTERM protein [Sphingomicrobium sp.]